MKAALSLGMDSLRLGQLPSRWGTLVAAISSSESGASSARKLVSTCIQACLGLCGKYGARNEYPDYGF